MSSSCESCILFDSSKVFYSDSYISMADEPFAKRKKLDVSCLAEVDANEVIKFRLLDPGSNASDLTEEASFAPEMAHQFFGEDEASPQHSTRSCRLFKL